MSDSQKTNTSIQPHTRLNDKWSRYAMTAVIMFAVGLIGMVLGRMGSPSENLPIDVTSSRVPTVIPTSTPLPYEDLARQLERSLVFIESTPRTKFSPQHGTGVIISSNGLILTNAHVINFGDVAGNITVSRVVGERLVNRNAVVIGIAPCEDLALLAISGDNYTPIPMNIAPTIGLGTEVFMLGYGQSTLTSNITLGFARGEISRVFVTFSPYRGLIEHTIELLPSDSGSPLFNRWGEMIGMNTLMDVQGRGRRPSYAINQERIQLALSYLRDRQPPPVSYTLSDSGDDTIYRLTDYFDQHCYTILFRTNRDVTIQVKPQDSHLFRPVVSMYDWRNQLHLLPTELRAETNFQVKTGLIMNGRYTVVVSRVQTTNTGADRLGDYKLTITQAE